MKEKLDAEERTFWLAMYSPDFLQDIKSIGRFGSYSNKDIISFMELKKEGKFLYICSIIDHKNSIQLVYRINPDGKIFRHKDDI